MFQSTNGQSNLADLKNYIDNTENVSELEGLRTVKFDSLSILTTYTELNRQIDFGFKHIRILIFPYSGWDLKLNLISRKGEIQIAWVSEFDTSRDKHLKTRTITKKPDFLRQYVNKHNEFYKTQLTESDFESQVIGEYVVGFGCSIDGLDIPKESKRMLTLVERKRRNKLNMYLTSFSPELQTLGTIGLLEIGNITAKEKFVIDHLKNRNSVIFSCSGCLYGIGETYTERIAYYE